MDTMYRFYHMLKSGVDDHELGSDYLDKLQSHRLTHYLVRRLRSLGHEVTLTPLNPASRRRYFQSSINPHIHRRCSRRQIVPVPL